MAHQVEPVSDRAFGWCGFGERCLTFAGPGAPQVRELAATELAAALGLSWESGRRYPGDAMEVRYRLPRQWARLAAGERTVTRAFRIAEATRGLCVPTPRWPTWPPLGSPAGAPGSARSVGGVSPLGRR